MKYILPLFVFFLFAQCAFAQEISLTKEISLHNDVGYDLIGTFKGRTLLFRDKSDSYEVKGYDEKMIEVWEKELEFDKRSTKILGSVTPNLEEFNIFYTFRKKGHPYLKVHKYDIAANMVDSMLVRDYGFKTYTPSLKMITSEDKTKVVFYYIENYKDIHALAFDMVKMEILWEHEFKDVISGYNRDLNELLVSDEGLMYLVILRNNYSSRTKPHYYEVHEYGLGQSETVIYNIDIQEYLTYDVRFVCDNMNGGLVGGGLYSQKNRGRSLGYFYLNVPERDHKNYTLEYHSFDEEFIREFMDKEEGKGKVKGIIDTELQEIVLRRDGGILLIGERHKDSERNRSTSAEPYNNRYGRFVQDFFYEHLFVISIHPSGEEHWKKVLHKKQYSYDDDAIFSSYFLLKTAGKLRLLFNDEVKNDNTVSEYVLNGLGTVERNSIMNTENQSLKLRFRDALQVNAKELIVPSEHRHRLRLVKISF